MRQIGTNKDGVALRDKLNSLISSTRELTRSAAENVKLFGNRNGNDKDQRIVQQKLAKDLQFWLQKFQEAYKIASDKEQSTPIPQNNNSSSPSSSSSRNNRSAQTFPVNNNYEYDHDDGLESKGLMDESRRQEQFQRQNTIDFQNNLILDRDKDIRDIERQVVEVNEIFRDISTLVVEQGQMIDSIESNIESGVQNTTKGVEDIQKASKYQRSSRNKLCCLALIILIILGVAILFIWMFGIKKI